MMYLNIHLTELFSSAKFRILIGLRARACARTQIKQAAHALAVYDTLKEEFDGLI